jgi:predicted signal transduction protein with EAL and GGDEF domain
VWLACFWSGGPSSGLAELYFFPVLYDAYFFRPKQVVTHLVINSMLAVSPLLYAASIRGTQFPGHVAVLISGFWGMSAVICYRKRRLLTAELMSRRQALSDPLTGLHNLRSLRDRAAQQPPAEGTAVLVIDIDDFKAVNTEYGHTGADELLRQVGVEFAGVDR